MTLRDRQRFGIDCLQARGNEIFILDMSALLHPELPSHSNEPAAERDVEVRRVASWSEFRAAESALAQATVIFFLIQSFGLSMATLRPLRSLRRVQVPYLTLAPNTYPRAEMPNIAWRSIKSLARRLGEANLANSVLSRTPLDLLGIDQARWHVVNGTASRQQNSLVGPHTKLIETGSQDFDIWLDLRHRRLGMREEAVFIDQFMPHHPDAIAVGRAGALEPSAYFAGLSQYFDWLEKTRDLSVVIAAHPRADYERRGNPFGGRRIVYGKTPELIADSRLVLAHHSTAIGLAVMFRKPVAVLTSDSLMSYIAHHRAVYLGFSDALQTPLVYLNRPDCWSRTDGLTVNEETYRRYESRFIRAPGSPERKMWEIVADAIS